MTERNRRPPRVEHDEAEARDREEGNPHVGADIEPHDHELLDGFDLEKGAPEPAPK